LLKVLSVWLPNNICTENTATMAHPDVGVCDTLAKRTVIFVRSICNGHPNECNVRDRWDAVHAREARVSLRKDSSKAKYKIDNLRFVHEIAAEVRTKMSERDCS